MATKRYGEYKSCVGFGGSRDNEGNARRVRLLDLLFENTIELELLALREDCRDEQDERRRQHLSLLSSATQRQHTKTPPRAVSPHFELVFDIQEYICSSDEQVT